MPRRREMKRRETEEAVDREEAPSGQLSQDRSRRRSTLTLSNYSNKRLTKTDMVVECLEATPHQAVALPALHSYLQENIARLTATSLTWAHDIKAACDLELAKPTSRIAELPVRLPRGPPAYKLRCSMFLDRSAARYPCLLSPRRSALGGARLWRSRHAAQSPRRGSARPKPANPAACRDRKACKTRRQHVTAEDLNPSPRFKPLAEAYAAPTRAADGHRRGIKHSVGSPHSSSVLPTTTAASSPAATSAPAAASAAASSTGALHTGMRVRARYSAPLGARWYGGVVEAANEDGVRCDDAYYGHSCSACAHSARTHSAYTYYGTHHVRYDDGDVEGAVRRSHNQPSKLSLLCTTSLLTMAL